jgi:hypothetical protein
MSEEQFEPGPAFIDTIDYSFANSPAVQAAGDSHTGRSRLSGHLTILTPATLPKPRICTLTFCMLSGFGVMEGGLVELSVSVVTRRVGAPIELT